MNNHPFDRTKRQTLLLRFWFEPEQGCWRVYLQEASTGKERLFANFPLLVAFLAQQLAEPQVEVDDKTVDF